MNPVRDFTTQVVARRRVLASVAAALLLHCCFGCMSTSTRPQQCSANTAPACGLVFADSHDDGLDRTGPSEAWLIGGIAGMAAGAAGAALGSGHLYLAGDRRGQAKGAAPAERDYLLDQSDRNQEVAVAALSSGIPLLLAGVAVLWHYYDARAEYRDRIASDAKQAAADFSADGR